MNAPRRIGILGLARSGRAAAELALAAGERVYASDAGDSPELEQAAEAVRRAGGEVELGGHTRAEIAACDLLVVSPGVPPTAPVLEAPELRSVPRISELEFAYRHLRAPIIAVTGTNGKSTTTALAAHLLRSAGRDACAAGNIGLALSEVALRPRSPDWVVVEASSFQLAGIERFAPRVGVVTNLSPDHLDRYPSVEAYYADKARLFMNATEESIWVLNGDDAEVLALPGDAPGRRLRFRLDEGAANRAPGAWIASDGVLVTRTDGTAERLIAAEDLPLLGEHNRANALAAALAVRAVGTDAAAIRDGLRSFRPLEHRLDPVADRGGVRWINDSKATNVESTRVALRSMTRPTVLLLGGRHKGESYRELLPELREHARLVIAYGEAGPRIAADLSDACAVEEVDGPIEAVVSRAEAHARPGDAVLLSPACSSYDMFTDYAERGRRFTELARGAREEVPDA